VSKKKLQIVVIGARGNLRNPFLESQLAEFDVTYIKPVIVLARGPVEPEAARVANRRILGRDLLNSEIGCALAHEAARACLKDDWGLILEDDVQIESEVIHEAERLVSQGTFALPAIITLLDAVQIPGQKIKIERLNHMPGRTIAYLASGSASKLDESLNSRIGTADWPLSFLGANFYAIRGTGVSDCGSVSTVDTTGERKGGSIAYYKNALTNFFPLLKSFGKDAVRYSILLPARRDFANRKRRATGVVLGWIGFPKKPARQ
jgi:GR25 family glycosyltransferase involved in LPS biosynthesis